LIATALGTVLPVSYHPQLELIVDPTLLQHDELYFNAARLDRSMALATADYRRFAKPLVEPIVCEVLSGSTEPQGTVTAPSHNQPDHPHHPPERDQHFEFRGGGLVT
jgi:hypothetical protein